MNNANPLIKLTLEAVAVLVGEPEDLDSLKRMISDVDFLNKVKGLNVYSLDEQVDVQLALKLQNQP